MSLAQGLYGVTYEVPEEEDTGWGPTVTGILLKVMVALEGLSLLPSTVPLLKLRRTDSQSLVAAGTIAIVSNWHRVEGATVAVTLSGATPIAAGTAGGQLLLLTGTHAVKTVTINDGGNVRLNGTCTLSLADSIFLVWDDQDAKWWEVCRNS